MSFGRQQDQQIRQELMTSAIAGTILGFGIGHAMQGNYEKLGGSGPPSTQV